MSVIVNSDLLAHYTRPLTINEIQVRFFVGPRSDITVKASLREENRDGMVRWANVETNIFDDPQVTADLNQLRDDLHTILARRLSIAAEPPPESPAPPATDDPLPIVDSLAEDIRECLQLFRASDMIEVASMLMAMEEQIDAWRASQ